MSCVLSIIGEDLDVDNFIKKSGLVEPYRVRRKGKRRFATKADSELLPYSVISIVTSEAGFDNFNQQVTDTINYLEKHRSSLMHIPSTKEVQLATIDFGISLNEDAVTQSKLIPNSLLKIAGEIGLDIELSFYRL